MKRQDDVVILYVDDDLGNRVVFEQSFAHRFQIRTAASGAEALEILAKEPIGVVVADQRMPGMPGNELLEHVKRRRPDVIRAVITAYADLDPILRAVNDGLVARYVIKPWSPADIENMLAWAIDAFRVGQEHAEAQLRLLELERLATLGSIQAAILHDISQPLSYMATNVDHLMHLAQSAPSLLSLVKAHGAGLSQMDRENIEELGSDLGSLAADMNRGVVLMRELVQNVQRMLKASRGTSQALTDPLPTLRFALAVCQRLIMHAQADLVVDHPETLPPIGVGSAELGQVLINLLANAAQALQRRGSPGGRLDFVVRETPTTVAFVIRDNGPGMSAEVLRKVGTPFFTTRKDGTGLGISQCRRLIEGAGGTLTLQSLEGVGTVVSFDLPRGGRGV